MNKAAQVIIGEWLQSRLSTDQWSWLEQRLLAIAQSNSDKELYITLGMVPRQLGKSDLSLNDLELNEARAISAGWNPSSWSIDGAARILTLLTVAELDKNKFDSTLSSLCATADTAEATAYFNAIHLYPHSVALDELVGHGLRSNVRSIFEAIAHRNPYPAKYFDEHRWNHMILKTLFIDSKLHPIQGIDVRANQNLAVILCNYAHERWSANRKVTPELWRCVGPYATLDMLPDLERASQSEDINEQAGALLALSQCPLPEAKNYVTAYPETAKAIANDKLTWDALASRLDS